MATTDDTVRMAKVAPGFRRNHSAVMVCDWCGCWMEVGYVSSRSWMRLRTAVVGFWVEDGGVVTPYGQRCRDCVGAA